MVENYSTGIILQARMGSSRLPGKMGRKFYNGKTLLRVILERLNEVFDSQLTIVATSTKINDDFIESEAGSCGVNVFRGSENDVLARFVAAAEQFKHQRIIRICADNPFIQTKFVKDLMDYNSDSEADYVGFRLNKNLPAIKSHLGFFPELVRSEALKEIHKSDPDPIYREHVTNFFYSSQNRSYETSWIDLDYPEEMIRNVRLTIDTESDFMIADSLYRYFHENGMKGSDEQIFDYLTENHNILNQMAKNISANEK